MGTNKLLIAGLAVLAFVGYRYIRSPLRTRVPPASAEIAGVRAQLDRLEPRERELVMGYLLRLRHETLSTFSRDDGPFDSRTFKDAIAAQQGFLEREGYQIPGAFLRVGVRDQLLRPLRAVVSGELFRRDVSSKREIFAIPAGYSTRYGNDAVAEEDKPILVTIYRVRNLGDETLARVEGLMEVRRAHRVAASLGLLNSCFFKLEALPPHGEKLVPCSNVNRGFTAEDREFVAAGEGDMHIVWEPRVVEFEDGRTIKLEERQVDTTPLWGIYPVGDKP